MCLKSVPKSDAVLKVITDSHFSRKQKSCMCACMSACMCACMCACMSACMSACMCVCMCVHMCAGLMLYSNLNLKFKFEIVNSQIYVFAINLDVEFSKFKFQI